MDRFRWSDHLGEEQVHARPMEAPEVLPDAAGKEHPGCYLDLTLPVVRVKPHYQRSFRFYVPSNCRSIPLRVTVQSDDLPDDVEEREARLTIAV